MPLYNVTVRAEFSEATIDELTAHGVYWVQGAADDPGTMRRRHHLRVQADDCDGAVERAARTSKTPAATARWSSAAAPSTPERISLTRHGLIGA